MDGGYGISATRSGQEGIIDKMALIEAMSDKYALNRKLQELVLKTLRNTGNGADEQLYAWEKFLESLPYRREPEEILRNPLETAKYGGDCDDFVVLALAGAKALGLSAQAEVVADSNLNGFHIRAIVGLPPINPTIGVIIDPVYRSEPEWAMIDKPLTSIYPESRTVILKDQNLKGSWSQNQKNQKNQKNQSPNSLSFHLLLLGLTLGGLILFTLIMKNKE